MTGGAKLGLFFEGQRMHFAVLVVLLAAVWGLTGLPGFGAGEFLGLSTMTWAAIAVADAVLHQVYVWLCWRAELHGQNLTRWFGKRAFAVYAAGFTLLFAARPVLVFALGWSNRGTLEIHPWLGYGAALVLAVPVVYLMISVRRYFTFRRAFGIDHFEPQYRTLPMERRGIFRFSPNAMYVFGFLALWMPAFLFQSSAALGIAAFSHAYIWVHYLATEKPDMAHIYG